jgi:hypothetical protein
MLESEKVYRPSLKWRLIHRLRQKVQVALSRRDLTLGKGDS